MFQAMIGTLHVMSHDIGAELVPPLSVIVVNDSYFSITYDLPHVMESSPDRIVGDTEEQT